MISYGNINKSNGKYAELKRQLLWPYENNTISLDIYLLNVLEAQLKDVMFQVKSTVIQNSVGSVVTVYRKSSLLLRTNISFPFTSTFF